MDYGLISAFGALLVMGIAAAVVRGRPKFRRECYEAVEGRLRSLFVSMTQPEKWTKTSYQFPHVSGGTRSLPAITISKPNGQSRTRITVVPKAFAITSAIVEVSSDSGPCGGSTGTKEKLPLSRAEHYMVNKFARNILQRMKAAEQRETEARVNKALGLLEDTSK